MANIWRFELEATDDLTGQTTLSHVHYQTDVPLAGSEPSAATVLDLVLDHYSSSAHNMSKWAGVMHNTARLTEARVRQEVTPGSGDIPETASEALSVYGLRGSPGSEIVPTGAAVWFAFSSAAAIRSGRGGTHLPPTQSAALLDGTGQWNFGGTWGGFVDTLADSILDKLDNVFDTTGDINPGVYSRTRAERSLSKFFELTAVTPSVKVRWVRRRDN